MGPAWIRQVNGLITDYICRETVDGTIYNIATSLGDRPNHTQNFTVGVAISNALCTYKNFNLEEKKVRINAVSGFDTLSRFEVAIPVQLLSGEFKLFVNGSSVKIDSIQRDGEYNIIHFIIYSKPYELDEIEILGTEVIPEFPTNVILLVSSVAAAFVMLYSRRGGNNSSRISFVTWLIWKLNFNE